MDANRRGDQEYRKLQGKPHKSLGTMLKGVVRTCRCLPCLQPSFQRVKRCNMFLPFWRRRKCSHSRWALLIACTTDSVCAINAFFAGRQKPCKKYFGSKLKSLKDTRN